MKHTPGPWKAIKNKYFYEIRCSEFKGSADIWEYSPSIGTVHQNTNYKHTKKEETAEANARLAAAAPEMYDGHMDILKIIRGYEVGNLTAETALNMIKIIAETKIINLTGMSIEEVLNESDNCKR